MPDPGHHRYLTVVHRPINYEFASYDDMVIGIGYDIIIDDLLKLAYIQSDDISYPNSVWLLVDVDPLEWVQIGAGSGNTFSLSPEADDVFTLTNNILYLDPQLANTVFAGPNTGGASIPTFRQLGHDELYIPPNDQHIVGQIYFPAASIFPSTTNGCADHVKMEFATNDIDDYVLAFDPSSIEYAQFNVWMPSNWDGGTITAQISWAAASGSGVVVWATQCICYDDVEAIDTAWGVAQSVSDTLQLANAEHYTSISPAILPGGSPAAGRKLRFRLYRNATSGSDTLSTDALLTGVMVYYTKVQ